MFKNTNLNNLFATDRDTEENGIWVDVDQKVRVKVRAYSAKAVVELREQLMRPYAILQRTGAKIPEDKSDEIGLKVVAGGVIADWAGVTGEDDKGKEVEIPYTAENAFSLLEAMPRFANFIVGVAMDAQMYKEALHEDSAKN